MKALVTGAAGFVGSHIVDHLLAEGHDVWGVDNFSTGHKEFLPSSPAGLGGGSTIGSPPVAAGTDKKGQFHFFERDLLDKNALRDLLTPEFEWVFHLAANADVKDGLLHPEKDLEQNTLVTWNILEAMRQSKVRQIIFSSTGSIYGEAKVIPTPEDCPFPIQTSLYGASKLACEGLISAYAEGYGFRGLIFRFVSLLGERYPHGHVIDFMRKLEQNPSELRILGNGKQRKSYLYVGDCIKAIFHAMALPKPKALEIFNLGTNEYIDVDSSASIICEEMKVSPKRMYSGGDRGWTGDNPFIWLDCSKIRATGWSPQKSIRDSILMTVRYLRANPWLLNASKAISNRL